MSKEIDYSKPVPKDKFQSTCGMSEARKEMVAKIKELRQMQRNEIKKARYIAYDLYQFADKMSVPSITVLAEKMNNHINNVQDLENLIIETEAGGSDESRRSAEL